MLPTNYSLSEPIPGIAGIPAIPAIPAIMVQTGPVRTWVLHVPGAKMTAVHTNSLKLIYGRFVFVVSVRKVVSSLKALLEIGAEPMGTPMGIPIGMPMGMPIPYFSICPPA